MHGALTDASAWNSVAARLRCSGLITIAPTMPLRSLHSNAAYLSAFLDCIDGPTMLVRYSYVGSMMSLAVYRQTRGESAGFRCRLQAGCRREYG